jgi:hypothetical protein
MSGFVDVQVESFVPDLLYQGYITLPADRWFTIQLPFTSMTLTRLGRISHFQRDLDKGFTLESMGGCVVAERVHPVES